MPLKRFCRICDVFNRRRLMLAFMVIGFLVIVASCTSFKYLTTVTEESFPHAYQCGKCHAAIYGEWQDSDHAKAFTNPHFRRATDNYSFDNCLSCHAPQPGLTNTTPAARAIYRDEGVTCVSCHLEEGKLSGPIDPTGKVAPHPIDVNPDLYRDSGMCGRCHQGEFAEWKIADSENKKSCQECHMPRTIRKVTQPAGWLSDIIAAFEHEVEQKKHDFSIIPSDAGVEIISIEAKRDTSSVILEIRNNLPHSLPSGDFGFRVLVLQALAVDSKGNQADVGRRELTKELASAISASSTVDWQLPVSPETVSLRVSLKRIGYEEDNMINLADVEVPLPKD